MKPHVLVIGCGAAGMFAACAAADRGARVTVLERNEKPGKKLYITGKGRCNLTNDCEPEAFFAAVVRGEKFLRSAVHGCDSGRVRRFFTERGCRLKTERGGRVFPVSDKASDIIAVLTGEMARLHVDCRYGVRAERLLFSAEQAEEGAKRRVVGVRPEHGGDVAADAVIVATGGLSYPATGSTGDGYALAGAAGHEVTGCAPSLVPLETKEGWCRALQGLTLKNVRLTLNGKEGGRDKRPLFSEQGELLFTHFGISGPLALSASAYLPADGGRLAIDLKCALSHEQLDERLQRDFAANSRRHFANSLSALFPAKLVPVMVSLAGEGMPDPDGGKEMVAIEADRTAGSITKKQRHAFGALIKQLPLTVTKTRGFAEAVVTRGGVALNGINPKTMASKACDGLFFAGEVLDCDALTGGFNLQIAWSTGYAAGRAAAEG